MNTKGKRLSDYLDMSPDGDRTVESEVLFDDDVFPTTICEKRYWQLLEILDLIKHRLTQQEEKIARYCLGIPEDLTAEDIENGKEFELGVIHTYRETAEEFDLTVKRVHSIIYFKLFRLYHCRKRKNLN